MLIGEKIQCIRKENKLSQEQLAEKLGVTRQAISRWEMGDSIPDIENIVLICRMFNITTDSLILGSVDLNGQKKEDNIEVVEEKRIVKVARTAKETIQKYFFIVGYVLMVIGFINVLLSITLSVMWNGFSSELTRILAQYDFFINLQFAFWIFVYMGIVALVTAILGIVIVKKMKRVNYEAV